MMSGVIDINVELLVAVMSAVFSLGAGIFSARANRKARELDHELERRRKAEDEVATAERIRRQYRDPLLDAANTLQSRIYNLVRNDYLAKWLRCGDPEQERYARDYTVFTLAEYLTWVEIVRRELRFLDVGDEEHNRQLMALLMQAQLTIQAANVVGPFRVFRGHQRAIAEVMMVPTGAPDGPRSECLGYATFCDRLDEDEDFRSWFDRLRTDVDEFADRRQDDRLVRLQNDLIDLLDHLDPNMLRIPAPFRQRLPRPPSVGSGVPTQATPRT
jgi:hypothetical protein